MVLFSRVLSTLTKLLTSKRTTMAEAFYSHGDVVMYLDGCVCLWKGKPVFISCSDTKVKGHTLGNFSECVDIDINSDDFDYKGVKLGYVNYGKQALYVARLPWRKTKAGVHYENTACYTVQGTISNIVDLIQAKEFGEMVEGIYPSEHEALQRLVTNPYTKSVAISRNIAIARDQDNSNKYRLYYKNELVATKYFNDTHFTLIGGGGASMVKKILARNVCLQ
jgi:hypothetical protein